MKTKRLLALTLALVLALGVWPMVALGDASTRFYSWDGTNGDVAQLTGSGTDATNGKWSNLSFNAGGDADAVYKGNNGMLVALTTGEIDATLTIGTLIISDGAKLTVTGSSTTLTVSRIVFLDDDGQGTTGSIELSSQGKLQIAGGALFTPAASAIITISPATATDVVVSAVDGAGNLSPSLITNAGAKLNNFKIVAETEPVTITNYNQTAGSTLEHKTSAKSITMSGNSTLAGMVKLAGGSGGNLVVDTSSTLTLNMATNANLVIGASGIISSPTTTKLIIGPNADLTFDRAADVLTGALEVQGKLTLDGSATGTIGGSSAATDVATVKSSGTLTVDTDAAVTFAGGLTVDQGGTLVMKKDITITNNKALTVNGTMNVEEAGTLTLTTTGGSVAGTLNANAALETTGGPLEVASGGTLNINDDLTMTSVALTVAGTATVATGATLELGANSEVSGTVNALATDSKLELNGKDLSVTSTGYLNFETLGTLSNQSISTDSTVTLNGRMRMYDPVAIPDDFQIDKGAHTIIITGTGTLSTNNSAGFGNYAMAGINTVPYYTPQPSYADTLISNTPVMAPVSTTYPGYGVFVISSTGFFKDFDPDKSLYANGVKMEVGVDYDVVDKGGYAQFNIYESFMQTLNGPVVFKATFISGKVSSATVSVQGVAIPDDITATAPKTGDSGSMLGIAVMLMAVAMAAVVKRVRA